MRMCSSSFLSAIVSSSKVIDNAKQNWWVKITKTYYDRRDYVDKEANRCFYIVSLKSMCFKCWLCHLQHLIVSCV